MVVVFIVIGDEDVWFRFAKLFRHGFVPFASLFSVTPHALIATYRLVLYNLSDLDSLRSIADRWSGAL